MIPTTDKELELFFDLMSLYESKKRMDLPFNIKYPYQDAYKSMFDQLKKDYLLKVKKLKK